MIYHFILKRKLKKIEYEVLLSFNIHFYVKMKIMTIIYWNKLYNYRNAAQTATVVFGSEPPSR